MHALEKDPLQDAVQCEGGADGQIIFERPGPVEARVSESMRRLGVFTVVQRPPEENARIVPVTRGLAGGRFSPQQEPGHFPSKCFEVELRVVAFFAKEGELSVHFAHLLPVLLRESRGVGFLVLCEPLIERYHIFRRRSGEQRTGACSSLKEMGRCIERLHFRLHLQIPRVRYLRYFQFALR